MKSVTLILLFTCLAGAVLAQSDKHKEERVRAFHQVLQTNEPEKWKRFIQENFSQSFIDRPMQARTTTTDEGLSTEKKASGSLDEKVQLFKMLHSDFGGSKIDKVTVTGDTVTMNVKGLDGLSGVFKLQLTPTAPHLIDRMSIDVERGEVRN